MLSAAKHWVAILIVAYLLGGAGTLHVAEAANAQPKRARWNQPNAQQKPAKVKNKKQNKKPAAAKPKKKASGKKPQPTAKKAPAKEKPATASQPKQKPVAKTKPSAKPPVKELTIQDPVTDDDIDVREERSTSPLLFVFAAFVLACVGGMFFISARRKQLEAARANFQDHTSNHEVAFRSRSGELDMAPVSEHSTPTTGTLFNQTPSSAKSPRARVSLFGKISSKAAVLLGSSSKPRGGQGQDMTPAPKSAFSFSDDTSAGDSITTISAVRSSPRRQDTRAPQDSALHKTQDTMSSLASTSSQLSSQGEPCSFERYVEIQVACRCWRAQETSVNQMLQKTFGISTDTLIQYEFYWKQKISGNINLRKKFEELEPLYSAKYQAA